ISNAGEGLAAHPGKRPTSGPKNAAKMNRTATVNAVKPVRPPAATPDPDSRYAVDGLVPNIAPAVVASESETSALRARGSFPSFNNPACFDTPINEGRKTRSEEHTSELQSRENLVCRLLLEKKKN